MSNTLKKVTISLLALPLLATALFAGAGQAKACGWGGYGGWGGCGGFYRGFGGCGCGGYGGWY